MKNSFIVPCLLAPFCLPQQVNAQKKPNIIFIMTDQQRGDAIGCSGNDQIITPNLDALAQDGYWFSNAYSATPSSTPARAGLLTGMSPWHHGMLGYGQQAEHYKYEMPQMVRDCGYMTLGVGKMHWHPQAALHGFHATILDESGRREDPYYCSDYRKWFMTQAPGVNPDITGVGWNDHCARVYQLPERLHPTTWTAETAIEVINNYNHNEPLFMKVSFARPHSPYDPPQRVLDMYKDKVMPEAAKASWSEALGKDLTDPMQDKQAAFGQFSPEYIANTRKHYYAAITFIDEQVGRIVKALKERGMYENTLILFVSDHGDMMGDHNSWRKTYAYEGSACVPMIIKTPSSFKAVRAKGSTIENPVELRDILPTFVEAAGGVVPDEIDGESMLHLIGQENPSWRRWIDMEHATCYSQENYWVALTDGKLKYIWFVRSGEEQLFDLVKDPQETENVATNKKYKKQIAELREAMVNHLQERGELWVKDGKLQTHQQNILYSPNFPKNVKKAKK